MNYDPFSLKDEARDEAYEYFDKNIRPLTKDSSGKVDSRAFGLADNDVDAFRHTYVSGVFTQVYSEEAADTFGRKYGKKTKSRKELLKLIHEALDKGELIIEPSDKRKYEGKKSDSTNKTKPVVVLKEDKNGRNELFFDLVKNVMLSREEFVAAIEAGNYPSYAVKMINGLPTPVSNPDGRETNNLS